MKKLENIVYQGKEFAIIDTGDDVDFNQGLKLLKSKGYDRYALPSEITGLIMDSQRSMANMEKVRALKKQYDETNDFGKGMDISKRIFRELGKTLLPKKYDGFVEYVGAVGDFWNQDASYTDLAWSRKDNVLTIYTHPRWTTTYNDDNRLYIIRDDKFSCTEQKTIPIAGFPSGKPIAPAIEDIEYARIPDELSQALFGRAVDDIHGWMRYDTRIIFPKSDNNIYLIECSNYGDPDKSHSDFVDIDWRYYEVEINSKTKQSNRLVAVRDHLHK